MSERVLRIEGLSARVGKIEILHGIDLEIRPGEVHAVMGPNGSGKSTLSHVLICLLYTSPSPRDLSTSRMPSSA